MAGLLAWATDVVGRGGGRSSDEEDPNSIPLIFTPEQQTYLVDLDRKASFLTRSIQDLRLRLPPPDISQRLPHLHAHSLASNAALALQLNSHSSTKHQAQLREVTLEEENAEFEKSVSNCETKIQEKLQEADSLRTKLKEMELIEENLKSELKSAEAEINATQESNELEIESKSRIKVQEDAEAASESALLDKLESKKTELASVEENVRSLENKWTEIQESSRKQPSPAQREKILDKQLHSLMEQLASKQVQAEGLVGEIHQKEMELERLNGVWRRLESSNNSDVNATRNRFGRSSSSDYIIDPHHLKPSYQMIGRSENLQRLMLLRSAFVIYILALHVLVFIRLSF